MGGSSQDLGLSIAVDLAGNAYVAGLTTSQDFPVNRAVQGSYGGGFFDGFLAKVNGSGSALVYSTYLGGNGADVAAAVATDGSGKAYVAGNTDSPNFRAVNPIQGSLKGSLLDAFLLAVSDGAGATPPSLASFSILRAGSPIDHLISGTKAKKYVITFAGSGFDSATQVFFDGVSGIVLSVVASEIVVKPPAGRIGPPGVLQVRAVNSAGQTSNTLTIPVLGQ